jgi:site-specific DNA-methyltransferase (adenine-specific)
MTPYYADELVTIYHGDCRELDLPPMPGLAVVSDPPYGMGWDTDSSRFSGGHRVGQRRHERGRTDWGTVHGDREPFDPTLWLDFDEVILWGANHFASRLPVGTTLVWIKRFDDAFGTFLSDAEVAWQKGGHGVYCRRDTSLMRRKGLRYHPTQKPLGLMRWCIERTESSTIYDPFAGSGTTLVAAKSIGLRAIGVEIDERWCEAAATRCAQEVLGLSA